MHRRLAFAIVAILLISSSDTTRAARLPWLSNTTRCGHIQGVTSDLHGNLSWTFSHTVIVTRAVADLNTDQELEIIAWRDFGSPGDATRCSVEKGLQRNRDLRKPFTTLQKTREDNLHVHIGDPAFHNGELYLPIQF